MWNVETSPGALLFISSYTCLLAPTTPKAFLISSPHLASVRSPVPNGRAQRPRVRPLHLVGDVIHCSLERRENPNRRKTRRNKRLPLPDLGAVGGTRSPPPEILESADREVRRNMERMKQLAVGEARTVRAFTSSALRAKLRLSGKDKRGRVFLPGDLQEATMEELERLLRETFPIAGFPVAVYATLPGKWSQELLDFLSKLPVKADLQQGEERRILLSDEQLRAAMVWADREGVDLQVYLDVHPDYQEELPAEWLVGVPDPRSAQEWEMLSFYRFVEIPHPEAFANMLQRTWSPLGVRGRVYVAKEGVNAQMAVPCTSGERFERAVNAVEKLAGVYLNKAERRWSRDEFYEDPPFPALHVRARHQIVADGLLDPLDLSESSAKIGRGLSPEEWHEMLEAGDATVLDCRNSYESEVGVFEEALPLDTSFFRESWGELERLVGEADRAKPIMTYCTGGIRCVKIAAYLEQEMGFTNVTRLEGGIVSYSKYVKEAGLPSKFKGVNYVFDKRMGDKVTGDMISKCHQCGTPCAHHINCANPSCHARLIQCPSCAGEYEACCSRGCRDQMSRGHLREAVMRAERMAMMSVTSAARPGSAPGGAGESEDWVPDGVLLESGKADGSRAAGGDGEDEVIEEYEEHEELETDGLMWLVWPFQDPSLNLLFDRAFEEHARGGPGGREGGETAATEEGASRLVGIVTKLGGGKRILSVGLGSGGPAGLANLGRVVEALEEGGELVAVEASDTAASATRGLSPAAEARGCSVTVIQCEEEEILQRLGVSDSTTMTSPAAARRVEGAALAPWPDGLFDVILLGGGSEHDAGTAEKAVEPMPVGTGEAGGGRASRSPAQRLDLVLDKCTGHLILHCMVFRREGINHHDLRSGLDLVVRADCGRRLVKKTGIVMCDPCALHGGERAANFLAARALDIRGVVEHARVPGAGPRGGLHIFKWKRYSH